MKTVRMIDVIYSNEPTVVIRSVIYFDHSHGTGVDSTSTGKLGHAA